MILSLPLFYSVCEKGQFNCTQDQCKEENYCPGSLVYSPRSCLLTCSSLDHPGQQRSSDMAHSSCREPISGCVCPHGTVLLVGESNFFLRRRVVISRSHNLLTTQFRPRTCQPTISLFLSQPLHPYHKN